MHTTAYNEETVLGRVTLTIYCIQFKLVFNVIMLDTVCAVCNDTLDWLTYSVNAGQMELHRGALRSGDYVAVSV